jgi:hypothetical protein
MVPLSKGRKTFQADIHRVMCTSLRREDRPVVVAAKALNCFYPALGDRDLELRQSGAFNIPCIVFEELADQCVTAIAAVANIALLFRFAVSRLDNADEERPRCALLTRGPQVRKNASILAARQSEA